MGDRCTLIQSENVCEKLSQKLHGVWQLAFHYNYAWMQTKYRGSSHFTKHYLLVHCFRFLQYDDFLFRQHTLTRYQSETIHKTSLRTSEVWEHLCTPALS